MYKLRNFVILACLFITACTAPSFDDIFRSKAEKFIEERNSMSATYRFDHSDKEIMNGAHGYFDYESKTPLKENQKMPIASGTKQMTAAIIMKLHEKGMVTLYDTISKFLPADSGFWPEDVVPEWADKVNIHMMLTHTSGLPDYIPGLKINIEDNHSQIKQAISHFVVNNELTSTPGTAYAYSNSNFFYLGLIIEKLYEKDIAVIFKEEIFDPLGMNESHMASLDEALKFQMDQLPGYPKVYFGIPTGSNPQIVPAKVDFFLVPFADGGVISTVNDLITWNRAFHSGKVVSDHSYKLMTTPYIDGHDTFNKPVQVGYGVYIDQAGNGNKVYYHAGRAVGIRSEHGYIPDADIYFAILSNLMLYQTPDMEGKVDYTNPKNQYDIAFFKNFVLQMAESKISNK